MAHNNGVVLERCAAISLTPIRVFLVVKPRHRIYTACGSVSIIKSPTPRSKPCVGTSKFDRINLKKHLVKHRLYHSPKIIVEKQPSLC
jgi:hypothetical protein